MEVFWCICSLIGISMILMNWFIGLQTAQRFFEFMKRHRIIAIVYVVLGTVGIFRAIIFG